VTDSTDTDTRPATSPYAAPPGPEPYDMGQANRAARISLLAFAGFGVLMAGMLGLLLFL